MVNWDIVSIVIFYSLLYVFFVTHRKKFTIQAKIFALYKTKLGLVWMNRIAKFSPRLLSGIAYLGVVIGFLGMGYILYVLVVETWKLLFVAGTVPALAPVLPGIEIPGAPTLGFWHWVITIFIAAVVHEFSHGVVARLHDVKVKSSGFAFLGPILAAFVEPDEKQMVKKSKWKQLSVFAAGPFSNIILGILIILFTGLVFSPFVADIYQGEGITVNELIEGHPMEATGVALPFTITAINGEDTLDVVEFQTVLLSISPGEEAVLTTSEGEISLITTSNPSNEDLAFFGITGLEFEQSIAESYEYIEPYTGILDWIGLLLLWLFM